MRFERLAALEVRPRLTALLDAATDKKLLYIVDDEILTLGGGEAGRDFLLGELPSVAGVPWNQLRTVPTAVVTGSNGKTTTVRLLARCARAAGFKSAYSSTDGVFLDDELRHAPHTLSSEGEGVMAAAGQVLQQPDSIYSQLANGELPFPEVTLSNGTKVQLTQALYTKYRQEPVRADRKKVFDAFWGAWKKYEGTLGQMLTTQAMGEEFDDMPTFQGPGDTSMPTARTAARFSSGPSPAARASRSSSAFGSADPDSSAILRTVRNEVTGMNSG